MFVSAVSLWEIWLKESLGKLVLPHGFEEKLAGESFENLPLTAAQARQVAQARVENLIFLTADGIVAAYGDFVRLAP